MPPGSHRPQPPHVSPSTDPCALSPLPACTVLAGTPEAGPTLAVFVIVVWEMPTALGFLNFGAMF